MPNLSTFILGLFVFLQSAVLLGWFAVDNKLLGFVGMAFVVVLVFEVLFLTYRGKPFLPLHRG
jgi:hypothetical protein